MKVVLLNGGLGNQFFQYAFARFVELYSQDGEAVYLDDSSFFLGNAHNGYELEKVFGIKPRLLSHSFDEEVWREILGMLSAGYRMWDILSQIGIDVKICAEAVLPATTLPVIEIGANQFKPEAANLGTDIYYYGYWINQSWYKVFENIHRTEMKFSPITEGHNIEYAEKIRESNSLSVHVRRGDFIPLNWNTDSNIYKAAIEKIVREEKDVSLFLFSDDIEWCKQNLSELGLNQASCVTFVEGNMSGNNFRDLQLMSMCKGMIITQSSFCYLAYILNSNIQYQLNLTKYIV